MKVKVKFCDTEFGLFEPSFTVPVLGTAERFRGIYLDFTVDGVPWSQLVLDQSIRRYQMLEDTLGESPVFASANDGVYWIIERILDSERECGEEIEIEHEGKEEGANDMKVKVKFRNTKFGLFEPHLAVQGTDGRKYRGIYLDFDVDGTPQTLLVLDRAMLGKADQETLAKNPIYSGMDDSVYWTIERRLSRCDCCDDVEIEYEGEKEGEMQEPIKQEKTIRIPADVERVKLEIKRDADKPRMGCMLAEALAMTPSDRPVIVRVRERNGLRWNVNLGPVTAEGMAAEDNGKQRAQRIATFSTCQMCDTQVLLERLVMVVGIESETHGSDAIVYEVEANGE